MSITLLANQVPAPQVPSTTVWIEDNAVATSPPNIPQAAAYGQGESASSVPARLNENAVRQDLQARYGAGAMGVCSGLVVSAGTGLQGLISAGHANIDGLVEIRTQAQVVLSASSTNCVWLRSDGAFEVRTDLTAPTLPAVLVGIAITDGSGVTAVDESGVVYIRAGIPERSTADTGKPSSTPPAAWRGWTKTLSADWWWDGSAYQRIGGDMPFLKDVLASGESVRVPTNHQVQFFNSLTVQAGASLIIDGKLRVTE